MPTAPPVARPSGRARSRSISLIDVAVLVVAALVVALLVTTALGDPRKIDVTVENPTDYDLNVRISPADGGSSFGLGQVSARSTNRFQDVNDQGDEWRVEFSYAGVDAGEMTVTRSSLASTPIVVPDSAANALRQAGIAPPP